MMTDIKHKHELTTNDINGVETLPSLENILTELGHRTCYTPLIKEREVPYIEHVSFNFMHYK